MPRRLMCIVMELHYCHAKGCETNTSDGVRISIKMAEVIYTSLTNETITSAAVATPNMDAA